MFPIQRAAIYTAYKNNFCWQLQVVRYVRSERMDHAVNPSSGMEKRPVV